MRPNALSILLGSGIVCLALAGTVEATVPRAFVSINGSDANPCSAAQPCRSFNQALTVVEPGGEIVVQNSGGYSTGFTITQSVTIDAAGFNASVISTSNTDLCTINAGLGDRVVLRGISFHGASLGNVAILVNQVGSLYVEHCSISEFTEDAVFMPFGGNLWVTNSDVRACSGGINFQTNGPNPGRLIAQDSRFEECTSTGVLVAAAPGGNPASDVNGWVSNCTSSGCLIGFEVDAESSANANLTLVNCRAFSNSLGLSVHTDANPPVFPVSGNATMRISNCVVTKNETGVFTSSLGGGIASIVGTNHGVFPKPGIPPLPGNNLIAGNGSGNAIMVSTTLQ
jgi:hypothetical protein